MLPLAAEFFFPCASLVASISEWICKEGQREYLYFWSARAERGEEECWAKIDISLDNVHFLMMSREVCYWYEYGVDRSLVSIVGLRKSTIAGILLGKNHYYKYSIKANGTEHREISSKSLMENFTMIGHNSWFLRYRCEKPAYGKLYVTDAELLGCFG